MKTIFHILIFLLCLQPTLANPKGIHIFGESHALRCFANEKLSGSYIYAYKNILSIPVEIHWLGPKTMHSFGRDGLNAVNIKKPRELDIINGSVITKNGKAVQENDIIIFTLGEIDVRNHIGKQRDQKKRTLEAILNTLVQNYVKTINLNRAQFQELDCIIMEITPPIDKKHCKENLPFYGTLQDRINITRQLNAKLQKACTANGFLFLPTHDLYALPDGSLNPDLSDHVIHVAFEHNYLIRERLIQMLINNHIIS